jgi:riboflavin synthase
MFTGIIEEIGTVVNVVRNSNAASIEIKAKEIMCDIKKGDSISTNGVCLTVSSYKSGSFNADVMPETMKVTNLGELRPGSEVNLERALTPSSRMGGHFVSGHIDGTGRIADVRSDRNASLLTVQTAENIIKNLVYKGSVAVDGTSLTVVDVGRSRFVVSIIPTTKEDTTLLKKNIGDTLNIECDLIAKYIANTLKQEVENEKAPSGRGLTLDSLKEKGW